MSHGRTAVDSPVFPCVSPSLCSSCSPVSLCFCSYACVCVCPCGPPFLTLLVLGSASSYTPACNQLITFPSLLTCLSSTHQPLPIYTGPVPLFLCQFVIFVMGPAVFLCTVLLRHLCYLCLPACYLHLSAYFIVSHYSK